MGAVHNPKRLQEIRTVHFLEKGSIHIYARILANAVGENSATPNECRPRALCEVQAQAEQRQKGITESKQPQTTS